jgi:hypothetical protein
MELYRLYDDGVEILTTNNTNTFISFTEETGNIYFRLKVDTLSNVKHPGIVLGENEMGERCFMHNHYANGRPFIDPENKFSKGMPLFVYPREATSDRLVIIERGLEELVKQRPYNKFNYNCQTFVNLVCFQENKSEDVNKWIEKLFWGTLIGVAGYQALKKGRLA